MIHLVDIDNETGDDSLEVAENQQSYVCNSLVMLARAWLHRKFRPRVFNVYDGETAVGMGMYLDDPEKNAYDFCQLFARAQKKVVAPHNLFSLGIIFNLSKRVHSNRGLDKRNCSDALHGNIFIGVVGILAHQLHVALTVGLLNILYRYILLAIQINRE